MTHVGQWSLFTWAGCRGVGVAAIGGVEMDDGALAPLRRLTGGSMASSGVCCPEEEGGQKS